MIHDFSLNAIISRLVTKIIPVILCCSIIFVLYALFVQDRNRFSNNDPQEYAEIGQGLWRGLGLQNNGMPDVVLPPGFPFVVGFVDLFVNDLSGSVKYVSLISFLLSLPLVFILSLFFVEDKKYAGLAVMLFAANSNILINAVSGYSESMFTLIFLTMGWMTLQLRKQEKTARILSFIFPILWAWLYYIKPEGLITGGIFFLWILFTDNTQRYQTWLAPIIVLILIFPYLNFLKEHTGRWQLSGKTYANLVMGELNSPYQTGIDNRTKDDRYYINDRTASNPALSYGFASYWYEKENDILLRIPVNVTKWMKIYWQTFSMFGIVLGVWGIVSLKRQSSYFLVTLMIPMAVYMIFFVLPRMIAMYHWIWIVFLMYGLKDLSFFIESKWKIRYTDSLIWTAAILIAVYQMRDAIKLII